MMNRDFEYLFEDKRQTMQSNVKVEVLHHGVAADTGACFFGDRCCLKHSMG